MTTNRPFVGQVEAELSLERAQEAAVLCAQGGHRRTEAAPARPPSRPILKLTSFVVSSPTFDQQAAVIDAASDVLLDEFRPSGGHARSAAGVVGVAALPAGPSVEIEIEIEIIVALRNNAP